MGNNVEYIQINPNEIFDKIGCTTFKKVTSVIISMLNSNNIKYKITSSFNIHINIKGKLSIAIFIDRLCVQIRFRNPEIFNKLDEYSPNIRNQLINAHDCNRCGVSDDIIFLGHSEHIFNYNGKKYRKCQSWCSIFRFFNLTNEDIDSIVDIIYNELKYNYPKRKIVR